MAYIERIAFSDLCDELQNSETEDALELALARFVRRNGFEWFAYVCKSADEGHGNSTYPEEWKSVYLERDYVQIDPVLQQAQKEPLAFEWNSAKFPQRRTERAFFSLATDFNVRRGITVPIAGTYGSFAALSLAASNNDNDTPTAAENLPILTLAALHYHMHNNRVREKLRLQGPSPTGVLSTRARVCLLWIARGKTVEETAEILHIHEATVRYHLNEARRRLNATSLAHLVAEAIRRHEITY